MFGNVFLKTAFGCDSDFVVQTDAGNDILDVCIFRHLDRKDLVFPNVMDCSHSTCSYVDLHCFFVFFFKYLIKFTVKNGSCICPKFTMTIFPVLRDDILVPVYFF